MRKSRKIILLLATHFLVAVICLAGSYYVFEKDLIKTIDSGNKMLNYMALISRHAAYVDMQKYNGDVESYTESLLLFSEALDESKKMKSPIFSENAYQSDKMLVKLALYKLEKSTGNTALAEVLLKEAVNHCNSTKMQDCSIEKILFISDKLESNSIFKE